MIPKTNFKVTFKNNWFKKNDVINTLQQSFKVIFILEKSNRELTINEIASEILELEPEFKQKSNIKAIIKSCLKSKIGKCISVYTTNKGEEKYKYIKE